MSVFADQGTRVPVQQILEGADVSRRTFYRFFSNREAVMLALYEFGTEMLLKNCRASIQRAETPAEVVAGCIDAHLAGVSTLGRLVYLLGGEAQSPDSPLYAPRMRTHKALAELVREALADDLPDTCDPLLVSSLLIALESIARTVLQDEGRRVEAEMVERARAVMMRLATATLLAPAGGGVTRLPEE
ncbi:TetR family transcriptional regulator [Bradymonas sediminis]|nr:TetR family transcriptional regulator [Bradymonas sediminis]